jgi:hypothetical protein
MAKEMPTDMLFRHHAGGFPLSCHCPLTQRGEILPLPHGLNQHSNLPSYWDLRRLRAIQKLIGRVRAKENK